MRRIMNIVRELKKAIYTEEEFMAVFDRYQVTSKEADVIIVILATTIKLHDIKTFIKNLIR
jgi:hypothetical protein